MAAGHGDTGKQIGLFKRKGSKITETGSGVKKRIPGRAGLKKEVPGTGGVKKRGSRDSSG